MRDTKTFAAINKPQNKKYSIIIPAAGMGKRMKSYGPKSLIKVDDNNTILDRQISIIRYTFNNPEIILVGGFEFEKIQKHTKNKRLKLVKNEDFETTNVMSSIKIGLSHASYNDIIIIYGDLVFNTNCLKAPFGSYSIALLDNSYMSDDEVGCIIQDKEIRNMMYDLPNKWAQIVYLTGNELDLLKQICQNSKYDAYFGFEILNIIINSGGNIKSYLPKNSKVTDIDTSKDLKKISSII